MSNGEKKSMSPIAWVAIGCGGCLVVVLLGMTACGGLAMFKFGDAIQELKDNPVKGAAMLVIEANPDLEMVSSDDDAGTMTVRTKDGETVTLHYNDIKNGNFSIETDEGTMSVDASANSSDEGGASVTFSGADGEVATFGTNTETPDWLPRYPGADDESGGFFTSDSSGSRGAFGFKTTDSAQEAIDWFTEKLENAGFSIASQFNQDAQGNELKNVAFENGERTVTVMAARQARDDKTQVTIQYTEKN
jgi:hypothetical protein